jgi:excinuclease ABC subunit C
MNAAQSNGLANGEDPQTTPATAHKTSDRDTPSHLLPSLKQGVEIIGRAVATAPAHPGVYRMLNSTGAALYVGKAKNLRKRLAAYTRPDRVSTRIRRMIATTATVELLSTHTEVEALLLESNLIKRLKPRYNVVLRDDKSFPYILITGDHEWARITKFRGVRSRKGEYFGPFASAGAVNQTLAALSRAFPLRSCSDNIFESRTRPCLQYQIKRCTAPCVGRISHEEYEAQVNEAREFLSGRSREIQRHLSARMQEASDQHKYETAAVYRDRIRALTQIQANQDVNVVSVGEADVFAVEVKGGRACVEVFFFRAGQNCGGRAYFPANSGTFEPPEVLSAFLGQFYENRPAPRHVLVSHPLADAPLIEQALGQRAGYRIRVAHPQRGARRKLVEHASANAREALARRLSESVSQRHLLEGTAKALGLKAVPNRIEVYDNSHISGTHAIGAMIVAGPEGLLKNAYRKFTIRSIEGTKAKNGKKVAEEDQILPGDDYGMMREVLNRRFSRVLKEDPERSLGNWPDLVIVDGGAGHLNLAIEALAGFGLDDLPVVAIAKGADRDAGAEHFHRPGQAPFRLAPRDPVLHFLQRLRDEAHRFAIGSHRSQRSKALSHSLLDEVSGVGARRKRALLHHFGSARAAADAGLTDLEKVEGISKAVAKKIYDHFHGDG